MQDAETMLSDLKQLEIEARTLVSEVSGKTEALQAADQALSESRLREHDLELASAKLHSKLDMMKQQFELENAHWDEKCEGLSNALKASQEYQIYIQ